MIHPLIHRVLLDHHPARTLPEITPDSTWADIGMDPLDVDTLAIEIEDELGVRVSDEAMEACGTVGELVCLISERSIP